MGAALSSYHPKMGIDNSSTSNNHQNQQDLEIQAETIINSHMADLDFTEDTLDDEVIHFSTVIPKNNNNIEENEQMEVTRSILPSKRRKLLNLRYLTRLRGLVKISQTIWALLLHVAIHFDYEFETYPTQKITLTACIFLIVFNLLIINGYVAFPHLTIKDAATRNGMLFSELVICTIFAIYFMICAPLRGVELILFKFNLTSLLLSAIFQGPLTILILYDLFGCFGEWSLVGMRPLGQRVAPKPSHQTESNAYTNQAFKIETGK